MKKKKVNKNTSALTFIDTNDEIIEVVDYNGKSLMLMPRRQVLLQQLPHRVVLVILRNKENQIYIHRRAARKKAYPSLWSVSASGLVKAYESSEDAALRELNEELGVTGLNLSLAAEALPTTQTKHAHIFLYISQPASVIINPSPLEISDGMYVDQDELEAMLHDLPEELSPALRWTAANFDLFNS